MDSEKRIYTAEDIDKAAGVVSDLRFHDHGKKYTKEEFDEMVSFFKKLMDDLEGDKNNG